MDVVLLLQSYSVRCILLLLRMVPYGCLSTGNKIGVIEVVLNAATLAKIQKEKGGGATGAFKNSTLLEYLKEHNDAAR